MQEIGRRSNRKNANSSNITITTVHLLDKLAKQCKIQETRFRAATVEALNGKKIEPGKQPGNKIRQK